MAHTSHDSAHTEILLRRSGVNGSPVKTGSGLSLLRVGEAAYSYLADPNDDGYGNGGDRLYIGSGPELWEPIVNGEGDSANRFYSESISTIGGKYFTDMMNHQRGVVTPASALLVDDNKKLNELLVDFLYFNKDSVSTEATNDLTIRAGTGNVIVNSNLQVTQNVQIDGTLTVDGIVTLKAGTSGQILMGDENTDNVVFGADINSNIIPNITDLYDLGSDAQRWHNITVKNIDTNFLDADSAYVRNNLLVGGNVQVDGTLTVDGIATLKAGSSGTIIMGDQNTDNVEFGADINSNIIPNVTDTFNLGSDTQRWKDFKVKRIYTDYLEADSVQINDTLNVDGAVTLNNTLDVDLATTLNSSLDVDGATTLNSSLDVDLATTLNSTLDVDGATTLNSTLDVDLAVDFHSSLQVDGNLNVDGLTTLDSTTIDGDLIVTQNLFVNGTRTIINSTELTVDDKLIVVADGIPSPILADQSGIVIGNDTTPIAGLIYNYNNGDDQWEISSGANIDGDTNVNGTLTFDVIDAGTYA